MLSGEELSEFEIDWTKDTHTWDAAEAESVPLVSLEDDTEEFSNYYTRTMIPNSMDETRPTHPMTRIKRCICFATTILILFLMSMAVRNHRSI